RGSGLVKIASAENLRRWRNLVTRFISLRPRSVSGRSSSGLFQFGQSASPWRRKQSFMMLEGKIVGQAFPPAISNQWPPYNIAVAILAHKIIHFGRRVRA